MSGLARRESYPITQENVREWFPSPRVENALAGEPWWSVQSMGLLCALHILRTVPACDEQQQALVELRRALDTALMVLPEPPVDDVDRRLNQTLAPYAATPPAVVEAMLNLAAVTEHDVVLDLGCGDGRIVFAAAARGAHGIGVDIDARLIQECWDQRTPGIAAAFLCQDVHKTDLRQATVITCYLLSSAMERLLPVFRRLKRGTRIVSHAFTMKDWPPARVTVVDGVPLFCWVV
jgi:SAM-dependent methyltransferase